MEDLCTGCWVGVVAMLLWFRVKLRLCLPAILNQGGTAEEERGLSGLLQQLGDRTRMSSLDQGY